MTLALNELCTNAIKYGALSKDGGRVDIRWSVDADDFNLRWVESGGPSVTPPLRSSFGSRLIEKALPRQMGGTGHMAFAPTGVEFELVIPLNKLQPPAEGAHQDADSDA